MIARKTHAPAILRDKSHDQPSAFTPESLLREARRQKGADAVALPRVCLLDPDGDILRQLHTEGRAHRHRGWVCYHTEMWVFDLDGQDVGIVGCAVGASFAVLVAEQMFASGCELLISITSSGQITPQGTPPHFILIDRALRDEGTSYHYLPPADWSAAPRRLLSRLEGLFGDGPRVLTGATWTTDAPFRETEAAIEAARARGILAVEMEAAALYAFAQARGRSVICLAHVTNRMGTVEGDFEKGEANGTTDALEVVSRIVDRLR
jgi:uridine phosphorylase